jgi:hypothetical protein
LSLRPLLLGSIRFGALGFQPQSILVGRSSWETGPFFEALSPLLSIGFVAAMPSRGQSKMKSCRNCLGNQRKAGAVVSCHFTARRIERFAAVVF